MIYRSREQISDFEFQILYFTAFHCRIADRLDLSRRSHLHVLLKEMNRPCPTIYGSVNSTSIKTKKINRTLCLCLCRQIEPPGKPVASISNRYFLLTACN